MMSDEIVRTEPGGRNGGLDRLHPEWRAEIREVDESIFLSNDELFRKSRVELKELHDRMQNMLPEVQRSNNAFAGFRFSTQLQLLDMWSNWLDWPIHAFDATNGYKLLDWIRQRKGDVPITAHLLDEAYAHFKALEPVPEPEVVPIIIRQPQSVVAEPLELASFNVVAEGSSPLSYEWMMNGKIISGEHSKRSSYQTVTTEFNNGAIFTCSVSNRFGQIISTGATLFMNRKSL